MSRRTVLVDDLDGVTDETIETLQFGLAGVMYEIDLKNENQDKMRQDLAPYIRVARVISRPPVGSSRKAPVMAKQSAPTDRAQLDAIRDWGNSNGYPVSRFGKIPENVMEAWERLAHPNKRDTTSPPVRVVEEIFSSTH